MNAQCKDHTCMLRKALMGNALFSTVSGLIILFAQKWVLGILGLANSISLAIVGVALIVYAATLVINARKQKIKASDAWAPVLLDVAWVVGSFALILCMPFSAGGKWVVAGVAEVVLVFAVLQFVGLRRIHKSEQFAS
jgi:hypothetical protein